MAASGRAQRERWQRLDWPRPALGPVLPDLPGLPEWVEAGPLWFSNGGASRGHPDRALPFSLSIAIGEGVLVQRVAIVGVFARHAGKDAEAAGSIGATVGLSLASKPIWRMDLVNGRHYGDAGLDSSVERATGDGAVLHALGRVLIGGQDYRLDLLTIDLPTPTSADRLVFKDLGSPASFGILDLAVLPSAAKGCPFHTSQGAGIALSELPGIVRVGDRVRFAKSVQVLEQSLLESRDLDEAKGEALTFLAVLTAACLEIGGGREMHRMQLDAARKLDPLESPEDVAKEIRSWVDRAAASIFEDQGSPSAKLVDRALAILDRNFARDLSDEEVADALGLSTSHFRFLFKQATGQPFHKYLIALRLEKARKLLIEEDLSVSAVAAAVGFASLSHFSRAFAQRFAVSPANLRRVAG